MPSKGSGKKPKNETDKGKGGGSNVDPAVGYFCCLCVCCLLFVHTVTCCIAPSSRVFLTVNSEVKLKELLSGLSSLTLSDAEALSVLALLREKRPSALDAWQKVRD